MVRHQAISFSKSNMHKGMPGNAMYALYTCIKYLFLGGISLLVAYSAYAQTSTSSTCNGAIGVCSGTTYTFPAGVNSGTAEAGADYGCLNTRPNPAWFFMQIGDSGSITISMSSSPSRDIDFIMWGPFSSPTAPCVSGLTSSTIVDCSYSTASSETGTIPNGQPGEYYIILITNYSNRSTNISFSQTAGTGSSNCDILCNITSLTATPGACGTGANLGTYSVTGTVNTFTPPDTGTLTVSSSCGGSVTFNPPFASSINYTLPNVSGTGGSCTITATYSYVNTCTKSTTITAPTCCSITPGSNVTVCAGQTINLSATGTTGGSYFWSGPNGFTSTSRTPSITNATTAHAGTYSVYLVNGACTTSVANVTVVVKPLPNATVTLSGSTTICSGDTVSLSVPSGTSLTYQWKRNGTNITGATSSSYTANQTGSYTVVVNQSGCTPSTATSSAVSVTVNALPTATTTAGGATTFCKGNSVTLTANTGTGLTYKWQRNGTTISGATGVSYPADSTGSYTVVVTDANGCSKTSTSRAVTVNPLPTATITQGDSAKYCPGGSVTLTANTGTGLSYQWFLNGSATTGTTSSKTVNTPGNYAVKVTDANSCSATSTNTVVSVNIVASASITSSGATTFCQGDSVVLTANTGAGFTYQWKLSGTNIPGQTALTYTVKTAGSYTVVVTQAGCTPPTATSTAVIVTVKALPSSTITGQSAFCDGDSLLLSANTGTGLTYQWQVESVNIAGKTSSSLYVNAGGNYTVIVTQNGCPATSSVKTITKNTLPSATIDTNDVTEFCQNDSVILIANGGIGSGLSYQWKKDGSNISGATASSYTAKTTGSYTVLVTNLNSCKTLSAAIPVVSNAFPPAVITPIGATTFCNGNAVELDANKGSGLSYDWKLDGNSLGVTTDSYIAYLQGSYIVIVTKNSCSTTSSSVDITVKATPASGKQIIHE